MRESKDIGGPAFPAHPSAMGDHDGMTLRDWFAGMAMQTLIRPDVTAEYTQEVFRTFKISEAAYKMADLMIQEREA